jgi:hypothetical protein
VLLPDHPILEQVIGDGWHIVQSHSNAPIKALVIVALNKTYPDGIDVIVSLRREDQVYVVYADAEHRLSGPYVTKEGTRASLADVLQLVYNVCQKWDTRATTKQE